MAARLELLKNHVHQSHGPGWLITLIEAMISEWHFTPAQAVYAGPLSLCVTLWPALLARHGAEVQTGHVDKARQRAKAARRAEIERQFRIIPTPPKVLADLMRGRRNKRGAEGAAAEKREG